MKKRKKLSLDMLILWAFLIVAPIICLRNANESLREAKEFPPLQKETALTLSAMLWASIGTMSFITFSFILITVKRKEETDSLQRQIEELKERLKTEQDGTGQPM